MQISGDDSGLMQVLQMKERLAKLEKQTNEWRGEKKALLEHLAKQEKALRVSEAHFRGIVGVSEDAIISIDEAYRITLFNRGAEKIFGYTPDEILGRSLDVLIPSKYTAAHRHYVREFAASPDALRPMAERGTIYGLRKDGTEFPAEATILKFEVEGEKVLTVRLRDITERVAAEQALRKSEERLRLALEAGQMGSWDLGPDAETELSLPGKLDELYNRIPTFEDAGVTLHPADLEPTRAALLEAIQKGSYLDIEFRLQQPDGSLRWIAARGRGVLDDTGNSVRLMGVSADISRQKLIEQQLRSLEQRLMALVEASATLLSSWNLQDIFPAILDLARRIIKTDAYAVWFTDQATGKWRVTSAYGLSAEYEQLAGSAPEAGGAGSWPIRIDDVEKNPLTTEMVKVYRTEGIRSIFAVPLKIQGHISGSIVFYCRALLCSSESEVRVAGALANLASTAIASAEMYAQQKSIREEAERAERRAAFLAEASSLLMSSIEYEAALSSVAQLAVPGIADSCLVDIVEEDGSIRLLAYAHVNHNKLPCVIEMRRRFPIRLDSAHGVGYVVRTGQPEILPVVTDQVLMEQAAGDPAYLEILREVGLTSSICVPLTARGRILGALTLVTAESGRRFDASDVALVEDLARRAALAIDDARLYAEANRERAAAEAALEALSASQARARRLVDSGIIGTILAESDRITEANEVFLELVGYSREDLAEGRLRISDLVAPELRQLNERMYEALLLTGTCTPFETEFVEKDGNRVPVMLGAALLEGEPGLSWVGFVIDLTERKQLEARLRESQRLESIGLLAGGVAHDFNNLLTGIMGNASLAQELLPPGSAAEASMENVIQAAERAADLTRQLLAYAGKGRFLIAPVDVSKLVRDISGLLRTSISKHIELRMELKEDLPSVDADASQIQQLIMNLLINAAEAIGNNYGVVRLRTGLQAIDQSYVPNPVVGDSLAPGAYVSLEVSDTGSGMDDSVKARIFDPFFTTKFTGRGLGLAAALGIIRGHRGDIQVSSNPGRGSTFRILLPASSTAVYQVEEGQTHPNLRGSGTILVVDDEELVQNTARSALERYGYEVLVAANGAEAVEIFSRMADRIALVLLDMTMPVMDGDEAFKHLRRIRPDVRVIVSSGYNEVEAIRRFTGKGIAGFIQKPYKANQLAQKVKTILEGGKAAGGAILPSGHM